MIVEQSVYDRIDQGAREVSSAAGATGSLTEENQIEARLRLPCDIAYSRSPTASRASSTLRYSRPRTTFPSRTVLTTA